MNQYKIQLILTSTSVLLFFLFKYLLKRLIRKHARKAGIYDNRAIYIKNIFNLFLFIIFIIVISAIWNITVEGLSVYFASVFAVVGVAFFGNWSILSSITASIILFFNYPIKIGNKIKIQDGDNNSIVGVVKNLTLFNIKILREDGTLVSYPNNLAIQKPIINMEEDHSEEVL